MDFFRVVSASILITLSSLSFAEPVNINMASASEIANALKGVGKSKAALVVDYRKSHGPFTTIDEVSLVKGIGSKIISVNRDNIIID